MSPAGHDNQMEQAMKLVSKEAMKLNQSFVLYCRNTAVPQTRTYLKIEILFAVMPDVVNGHPEPLEKTGFPPSRE
jgi:hypothetical protein